MTLSATFTSQLEEPEAIITAMVRRDPRWVSDPYPLYAKLRAEAPVHRSPSEQMWFVSSYDDVHHVQRHTTASTKNYTDELDPRLPMSPTLQRFRSFMIFQDSPEHDRIRGVTRAFFTKRALEGARPYIEQLADRLISEACEAGIFDYMTEFANRVSVSSICHVLGVPQSDHELFEDWNTLILGSTSPSRFVSSEQLARADIATLQLEEYFRGLVAERQKRPQDDLLSVFVMARDKDHRLTEDEVMGLAVLLLIAGTDTTGTLIANGTLALLEHPDELERLRADPRLTPNAIEEFLRYNSVVHTNVPRIPIDDTLILADGTIRIPKGEQVIPIVASANRDPARFDRPDELDVGRPNANQHMGFGHGLHLCLGANLARLNGSVVFSRIAHRFRHIEVMDNPLSWFYQGNIRSLKELTVRVSPT
jgi:cytochrome P450